MRESWSYIEKWTVPGRCDNDDIRNTDDVLLKYCVLYNCMK